MAAKSKTAQLQVRVSAEQKAAILRAAKHAGMDMSAYVLTRVLSIPAAQFQECVAAAAGPKASYALAELNVLLTELTVSELRDAVAAAPAVELSNFTANYIAAMVELACARRSLAIPRWTKLVQPLNEPAYGSPLPSLRHYLLTHSPAAFRRRNIFIDSTLGARV